MKSNFEVDVKGHGACGVLFISNGLRVVWKKSGFGDGKCFGLIKGRKIDLIARVESKFEALEVLTKLNSIVGGLGFWTISKNEILALSNEQRIELDRVSSEVQNYLMEVDEEITVMNKSYYGLKEISKTPDDYNMYHLDEAYNYSKESKEEIPEKDNKKNKNKNNNKISSKKRGRNR